VAAALAASADAVSGALAAASCAFTAATARVADDFALGGEASGALGAPANASDASVPGATLLPLAATGPRSVGAGGALGDTSGSTSAVGLSMPGGAFVVRLASGPLQAPRAAVVATSIRVNLDIFMRAPGSIMAMRYIANSPRDRAQAGSFHYKRKVRRTAPLA